MLTLPTATICHDAASFKRYLKRAHSHSKSVSIPIEYIIHTKRTAQQTRLDLLCCSNYLKCNNGQAGHQHTHQHTSCRRLNIISPFWHSAFPQGEQYFFFELFVAISYSGCSHIVSVRRHICQFLFHIYGDAHRRRIKYVID